MILNFTAVLPKLSNLETALCLTIIVLAAVVAGLTVCVFVMRKRRKKEARNRTVENILKEGGGERVYGYAAAEPGFFDGAMEDDGEIPTVFGEISKAEAAPASGTAVVAPVAPPVPAQSAAELDGEFNAMRYNRSFRARLIQSADELKEWYGAIKNEILSYDRVTNRISWKYESFSYRRNAVAKMFIKGKTLCLYLALNPADYDGSKFSLEDESAISQFKDTPALYRIKSEKRVRYAAELIADVCAKLQTTKTDREPVDYYEPYNGTLALIQKGLIKRVIEDAATSFTGADSFNAAQDEHMSDAED